MEQIYLGNTEKLYLRIYVGGVLTDADAAPTVAVKDSAGTTLRSVTASHESTGVYYVYTTPTETSVEQVLTYNWTFAVAAVAQAKTDTVTVVTPYVSIGDVAALAPVGTSYTELKNAEFFSRLMIESYLGQAFGKKLTTLEDIRGTDYDVLILPKRIYRIDSLAVDDEVVWTRSPAYNSFGYDLQITDTGMAIKADKLDQVPPYWDEYQPIPFQKGRDYDIIGMIGYETPPVEITFAAKLLAEDYFCTDTAYKKKYVDDIKSSDWSVKYNPTAFTGTGNFYADSILAEYKSVGMVII